MRILLLTQWFDPEPTFKGLLFAKALQKRGFDVEVITGFPNYPGGKIYSGYDLKLYKKEIMDGVKVHRVWLYPSHDGSALKRIFNYMSFFFSSFLFGLFFLKRFDVVYVYHPPVTVGLSAAFLSYFKRMPFVYDIQDLWPDTLKSTGMLRNEKILKVISHACDWIYRRAAKLVVLSPGFKRILIERGVPEGKIEVVYNWCDEAALSCRTGTLPQSIAGRFNIIFAGNMGKVQGLDAVLAAAQIVKNTNDKIQFVFVGSGLDVERLKKITFEKELSNVLFLPRMSMPEVGFLMSHCDVLLVHLKNDPLFEITVPSKTQAYMAMGKPILMAVGGDAAEIIRQAQAGVCVPSEDARHLASAAIELAMKSPDELKVLGDNAKKYYYGKLSFEKGTESFARIFAEVAS